MSSVGGGAGVGVVVVEEDDDILLASVVKAARLGGGVKVELGNARPVLVTIDDNVIPSMQQRTT